MEPDDARERLAEERDRLQQVRADYSILEQVEAELADVDRALLRLDDGTYGQCEACGEPITDDRLDAMPAARFCAAHEAQAEASA